MLRIIERATRQPIEAMSLPTLDDVNERRATKFKQEIADAVESKAGDAYRGVLEDTCAKRTPTCSTSQRRSPPWREAASRSQ